MLRAKKNRVVGSRACHGCDGRGWVPITEPAHYVDTGAPDSKVRRVLVPAKTLPVECIICDGEGLVIDQNGSVKLNLAGGPSKLSQRAA